MNTDPVGGDHLQCAVSARRTDRITQRALQHFDRCGSRDSSLCYSRSQSRLGCTDSSPVPHLYHCGHCRRALQLCHQMRQRGLQHMCSPTALSQRMQQGYPSHAARVSVWARSWRSLETRLNNRSACWPFVRRVWQGTAGCQVYDARGISVPWDRLALPCVICPRGQTA